jgi:hypothetical protein
MYLAYLIYFLNWGRKHMINSKSKTTEDLLIKINQLEKKISELEKAELKCCICLENLPVCTKIFIPIMNLEPMLIDSKAC